MANIQDDTVHIMVDLWMQEALAEAKKAYALGEVPVGAVLVYQDKVIARGHNQPIGTHDPSAHAEIACLRQAALFLQNYRLIDTTLVVTLEPCMMCYGAMVHARIGRLIFGASDPKTGVVGGKYCLHEDVHLNHKMDIVGGVLEDESRALLQAFFKERR